MRILKIELVKKVQLCIPILKCVLYDKIVPVGLGPSCGQQWLGFCSLVACDLDFENQSNRYLTTYHTLYYLPIVMDGQHLSQVNYNYKPHSLKPRSSILSTSFKCYSLDQDLWLSGLPSTGSDGILNWTGSKSGPRRRACGLSTGAWPRPWKHHPPAYAHPVAMVTYQTANGNPSGNP